MRSLSFALMLLVAAPFALANDGGSPPTATAYDFEWRPDTLVVAPGGTARFELGEGFHRLGLSDGSGSCDLPCEVTFPQEGRFGFYCTVHPWMTGTMIVTSMPKPDLRVDAVDGGPAGAQGARISYTLTNGGLSDAGAFAVRVEVREEGAWRTLATRTEDALAQGASVSRSLTWTDDEAVRAGRFAVRVTADATDAVDELDEANNAREGTTAFVTPFLPGQTLRVP